MREANSTPHSYAEYDPGHSKSFLEAFATGFRSGTQKARQNSVRMAEHFGNCNDSMMKVHDRIWSRLTLFTVGLFFAGLAWLIVQVFKLVIPASWTFVVGLLNVIATIAVWVFFICLVILAIGWLFGAFSKFQDWLLKK